MKVIAVLTLLLVVYWLIAQPTMFEEMCPMWSCNTDRAYP